MLARLYHFLGLATTDDLADLRQKLDRYRNSVGGLDARQRKFDREIRQLDEEVAYIREASAYVERRPGQG